MSSEHDAMLNALHEWRCGRRDTNGQWPTVNECDAFRAGFRAALDRAEEIEDAIEESES